MRYLLDHVPNHCAVDHLWFQAAQADPQAPETEFFTFHKHPHEYATWMGVRALAKLNYRSEKLRWLMFTDEDALFKRWLRMPYAADGWRVDAGNMLGHQEENQMGSALIRQMRTAVKALNPDAYLLGEHFFDGPSVLACLGIRVYGI